MSAEIVGFEPRDNHVVMHATLTAAAISVETGVRPDVAYNNRGSEYATKLTIVALRAMGIIEGDIDPVEFDRRVSEIERLTLPSASRTTLSVREEG